MAETIQIERADGIRIVQIAPGVYEITVEQGGIRVIGITEQGIPGPNEVTTDTSTDITGILKGNGAAVSGAVPNTDVLVPGELVQLNAYWRFQLMPAGTLEIQKKIGETWTKKGTWG